MVKSESILKTTAAAKQDPFSPKETLVLSKTLGGNISQSPLEFTKDSKYFFSGVGSAIKIYSIATGAVVKVLSRSSVQGAHKAKVTSVLLNPKNPLQLLSASLDGTIKLWDYNDEVLLKTFVIDLPIKQLVLLPNDPDHAYLLVSSPAPTSSSQKKKTKAQVYQYYLDTSTVHLTKNNNNNNNNNNSKDQLRMVADLPDCHMIALSNDTSYLAMATRQQFHIWRTNHSESDVTSTQLQSYTVKESVTQIAFHPSSTYVAVGCYNGQIVFYHCLHPSSPDDTTTQAAAAPVVEKHHWHSTPVRSLKFMDDGNYLLSGGDESVLVVWQLGTGFRRYFPRIGGEINYISITPDYKHFCVSLGDNSIRMINAVTQTVEQVIQGVQQWEAPSSSHKAATDDMGVVATAAAAATQQPQGWSQGMVVEPRNHHLVMNGAPGLVQFYDSKTDHHALELEIIPNNRNTRPMTITSGLGQQQQQQQQRGNNNMDRGHISHLAFSPNGEWMATVDMRDDQISTTMEVYLKFWQWDHDQQTYVLHTRVDCPHKDAITSLCFHPSKAAPMAVTTSMDKSFKVWHLSSSTTNAGDVLDQVPWTCRSVGVYRHFWPSACAFSADGSMLTVAFGPVVTVWDPYQNTLQGVLSTPEIDAVQSLHFINDSPYLVSQSKSHLFVWNLLTCTVWWSYQMSTRYVAVDPRADRFIVVVKDDLSNNNNNNMSQLVLFEPSSPQPLLVQSLDFICQGVAWLPPSLTTTTTTMTEQSLGEKVALGASDLVYLQPNHTIKIMSVVNLATSKRMEQQQPEVAVAPLPFADEQQLFNDAYGTRQQQKIKDTQILQSRIHANTQVREDAMRGKRSFRRDHHNTTVDLFNAPSHILPRVDAIFESYMATLMTPRSDDHHHHHHHDADMEMDINTTETEQQLPPTTTTNHNNTMVSTLGPLPSLEAYFATLGVSDAQSKPTTTMMMANHLSSSSDGDDSDDDDDDVENIDW